MATGTKTRGKAKQAVAAYVDQEIHDLSLKSIEVLPDLFQTRARIDMDVVQQFVRTLDEAGPKAFPPVLVGKVKGEDRLILADGFHRHKAHVKRRLGSIRAMVREISEAREALLLGIEANLDPATHRKPEEEDRYHAVKMMIRDEEFRTWSDSEIGRRCGIDPAVVRKIRIIIREEEKIPLPERIKRFCDGIWTGQWRPYRTAQSQGHPVLVLRQKPGRKPRFQVNINKKSVDLGSQQEEAQRRLDQLLRERDQEMEETYSFLKETCMFQGWLFRREILAHSPGRGHPALNLGYLQINDDFLIPCAEVNFDGILIALGKVMLLRKQHGTLARTILVIDRRRVKGTPSFLIQTASCEPDPIEFMTPEEVVSEFGPRPDAEEPTS